MNRKEIYARIKELGLEEAVKQKYGRNYTQVNTDVLIYVVNNFKQPTIKTNNVSNKQAKKNTKTVKKAAKNVPIQITNPYEAACVTFVGILKDSGLLDEILKKL